jgi:hypothetical protein
MLRLHASGEMKTQRDASHRLLRCEKINHLKFEQKLERELLDEMRRSTAAGPT